DGAASARGPTPCSAGPRTSSATGARPSGTRCPSSTRSSTCRSEASRPSGTSSSAECGGLGSVRAEELHELGTQVVATHPHGIEHGELQGLVLRRRVRGLERYRGAAVVHHPERPPFSLRAAHDEDLHPTDGGGEDRPEIPVGEELLEGPGADLRGGL